MKRIGDFLEKHTKVARERKEQTVFIQEVFKKYGIALNPKDISYKNNTVFVTTSPLKKGEIMSQKKNILRELSPKIKGIQEIR